MQILDAIRTFRTQQVATLRHNTQVHYVSLLDHIQQHFGGREMESITAGEIGLFLESQTANKAKSTRRLKYAQVKAFFNFVINECLMDIKNHLFTSADCEAVQESQTGTPGNTR